MIIDTKGFEIAGPDPDMMGCMHTPAGTTAGPGRSECCLGLELMEPLSP